MKENGTGFICGGVVSESEFLRDPMSFMMAYTMPDDKFAEYVKAVAAENDKESKRLFDKYAKSNI